MSRQAARVCVLVSGGVDSSILVADLLAQGREVHPLYVRCGYRWERAELAWLKRLLRRLASPRLRPLAIVHQPMRRIIGGAHWSLGAKGVPAAGSAWESVHLPGRNLLLFSEAAVFCRLRGIGVVAQAVLKGNPFSDATPRFRRLMEGAIRCALGAPIRLEAPYSRLTKKQVLRRAPGFPLSLTFSCLRPKGSGHCGRCSKCEERQWVL